MNLVRSVMAVGVATIGLLFATPAFAHEGGHQGGCAAFGQLNHDIAQDPAAFGFPDARNLGDIVSSFATLPDGQPGVGDVVETVDHAACG
jgi:hypothetical protein